MAQRLAPEERGALSKQLLTQVIHVIQSSNTCAGILIISRDENVLSYARTLGVESTVIERHNPYAVIDNLNAALYQGATSAITQGADATLILPADLPLITAADLNSLANAGKDEPCVVIAPSEDNGTNALLLNPPSCIDFAFGVDSFTRHQAQAQARGITFKVIHSSTLAFDVDRPSDLDRLTVLSR